MTLNIDEIKTKVKDFKGLLDQIENVSDKRKQLWREIYENAIIDRQNAYAMFGVLSKISADKSTEHAVHGKTMAIYIERMSKANDQLIKLAELIDKANPTTPNDDPLNPENLFEQIKNN
jgi:hypothetical protein